MSELAVAQIFTTKLTDLFGILHPIILAPMLGISMGKLAGAVAAAGGLGFIGIGAHKVHNANTVIQEWEIANEYLKENSGAKGALGVGFIIPFMVDGINDKSFQATLELKPPPAAIWLAFGECGPFAQAIHERGIKLIAMVNSVVDAITAKNQGVDVVVVQGSDAGGHGGFLASIVSLVPETRDCLGPDFPVVAAGGIVDGRGLACALTLGASGIVLGTRMVATHEAKQTAEVKQKLINTQDGPSSTVVTQIFDNLGPYHWAKNIYARAVINGTISKYSQHLQWTAEDKAWYVANRDNVEFKAIWCGAAIGLIKSVVSAGEAIKNVVTDARQCLLKPESFKFV